jgi:hypothetical protein
MKIIGNKYEMCCSGKTTHRIKARMDEELLQCCCSEEKSCLESINDIEIWRERKEEKNARMTEGTAHTHAHQT